MGNGDTDLHDAEIARLDDLIATLEAADDLDTAVHATRKGVKRLRAHLRLSKTVIDADVYRAEDADLSVIGRALAPARDAFVLSQTLESLESSDGWGSAARSIEAHHRTAIADLRHGPLEQAIDRLRTVRARWLDLPKRPDPAAVRDGIMRSYRKGAATETTAATGHAEAFHRWRKQVKYLRYQLEATGGDPAVTEALLELGETLGVEHDHSVFIDFVDDNIDMLPDRRDRYVLIDRAEARREQLRALALSTDVYGGSPDDFVEAASAA